MKSREKAFKKGSTEKGKEKACHVPSSPLIVLHGKRELLVYDCRKILRYERDEILLLCGKQEVLLQGKNLFFVSFSMRAATIKGELTALSFPTSDKGAGV